MKTPIADFVKSYADSDVSRLHMPGHKGQSFLGIEKYDITEIGGADVLYSPDGIIKESEDNATSLFGTKHTFYSTEGSSLCIRAMIFLAAMGEEKPLIIAARNVHKAFIYATALSDADVQWIFPKERKHLCACEITREDVKTALEKAAKKPCAVYVTSPDYLGNMLDIKGISEVCNKFGVPLLVDNAHGAYLNFLETNQHPIYLGADMCCDSAHKTLPVLTGGAYLHIAKTAPLSFSENARSALSLFASTSPSYLTLQSLDLCNAYFSCGYKEKLNETIKKISALKEHITKSGFTLNKTEELKIVIHAPSSGYSGQELAEKLRNHKIECEFCDDEYLVMMFTPETRELDFERLTRAFSAVKAKKAVALSTPLVKAEPIQAVSIRKAVFSSHKVVSVENAAGKICGSPTVSCPPAVPIAISGEIITEETAKIFKQYNIKEVEVVN